MLPRFPSPTRDKNGLPVAGPLELRVSRVVTAMATLWFLGAAGWELFGPHLSGHYAASAGLGIAADNMLACPLLGPVLEYTHECPPPTLYYCHHPWGIFWTTAALMRLFGHHDFVCRLAPVLLSAATPVLLYRLGRALWRPVAGAVAALGFTVLPITLAFANFNALEVPVIAWSMLGCLGFARLIQTGRRRHLAVFLLGTLAAVHADWPALVLIGVLLGFGLLRGYLARAAFGPVPSERGYAEWWILSATLTVVSVLFYFWAFHESDKLSDLLGAFEHRATDAALPLAKVLESRRYWIELCFTPIAIALGKLAAIVGVCRLLMLRREIEVIPLAVLLMATVQYVVFKQGADVHVFWPHYFGAFFALGLGQLVATLAAALEWIQDRRRAPEERAVGAKAGLVAFGCALLPLLGVARDGIPALGYARITGGRFNEKGLLIDSEGDKAAFLRWVEQQARPAAEVSMHSGMRNNWSQNWTLARHVVRGNRVAPTTADRGQGIYLADSRFLPSPVQNELMTNFHVVAVGPFWRVLTDEPPSPLEALAIIDREPSAWEWYFVLGTEPQHEVAVDPFLTWELRTHFGQPADVPREAPQSLEQKRIAHNIAVARGDSVRANELLTELERALRPVHVPLNGGAELLGTSYRAGTLPLFTLYLRAGGPSTSDLRLSVTSRVTAPAFASSTMADPTEREVGLPFRIPSTRWIRGFIYSDPVPIRKRPGTEEFVARLGEVGYPYTPIPAAADNPGVRVLKLPEST
jgi:hypothetical protein